MQERAKKALKLESNWRCWDYMVIILNTWTTTTPLLFKLYLKGFLLLRTAFTVCVCVCSVDPSVLLTDSSESRVTHTHKHTDSLLCPPAVSVLTS